MKERFLIKDLNRRGLFSLLGRKMPKIGRCESFGVGYDEMNEMCRNCKSEDECLHEQSVAQAQLQCGMGPTPPIVHVPTKMVCVPVEVTKPTIEDGKVTIRVTFDLAWMKKVLGLGNNENQKSQ